MARRAGHPCVARKVPQSQQRFGEDVSGGSYYRASRIRVRESLWQLHAEGLVCAPPFRKQSGRTASPGETKNYFGAGRTFRPLRRAEEHEKFEPLDDVEEGMMHQGRNVDDGAGKDIESAEVSI